MTQNTTEKKKAWVLISVIAVLALAGTLVYRFVIYPANLRKEAEQAILEHRFERAMEIYELLKDEEGKRWTRYSEGLWMIETKEYETAVKIFTELKDYKDSADQANNAKYGYVRNHYDNDDTVTFAYLKELVSLKYKDSDTIYHDLYDWRLAEFFANSGEEDFSTKKTSFSANEEIYIHYLIAGGTPGETVRPRCVIDAPDDGDGFSNDIDISANYDQNDSTGYSWVKLWYFNPYTNTFIAGPTGTYHVQMFINGNEVDTMNLIRR